MRGGDEVLFSWIGGGGTKGDGGGGTRGLNPGIERLVIFWVEGSLGLSERLDDTEGGGIGGGV